MVLHEYIELQQRGALEIVVIKHPVCRAAVALQGAQLLSWQPSHMADDVLWLSHGEPFIAGQAIRGGIPICYPWFGKKAGYPAHGTARIQPWILDDYAIDDDTVSLILGLYGEQGGREAEIYLTLGETCRLQFIHCAVGSAQAALHSYFSVADIEHTQVIGLPTTCYDAIAGSNMTVPSPRKIIAETDCIYSLDGTAQHKFTHTICDDAAQRVIQMTSENASDIVLWNPWHHTPSTMQVEDYRHMLCLEAARISTPMQCGDVLAIELTAQVSGIVSI